MKMKSHLTLLSCAAFLIGSAAADVPRKMSISRYSKLWTDSVITSPPVISRPQPGPQLSDEFALAGVSPIDGGYRVTLMNRKNPGQRTTIDTDVPNSGYKILNVSRKAGDLHGTTVTLSIGSRTGTLGFDEALLARVKPVTPPQPGQPQHSTRPRVVAPSNP